MRFDGPDEASGLRSSPEPTHWIQRTCEGTDKVMAFYAVSNR